MKNFIDNRNIQTSYIHFFFIFPFFCSILSGNFTTYPRISSHTFTNYFFIYRYMHILCVWQFGVSINKNIKIELNVSHAYNLFIMLYLK